MNGFYGEVMGVCCMMRIYSYCWLIPAIDVVYKKHRVGKKSDVGINRRREKANILQNYLFFFLLLAPQTSFQTNIT